jgi:hypothetical protein
VGRNRRGAVHPNRIDLGPQTLVGADHAADALGGRLSDRGFAKRGFERTRAHREAVQRALAQQQRAHSVDGKRYGDDRRPDHAVPDVVRDDDDLAFAHTRQRGPSSSCPKK